MPCASCNRQEINSWVQVVDALKEKECGSVDGRGWNKHWVAAMIQARESNSGVRSSRSDRQLWKVFRM